MIEFNPSIQPAASFSDIVLKNIAPHSKTQSVFYRPIQILSYRLDYLFWGKAPIGYHLSNFLYHALAAFLLFIFLRHIFGEERPAFWAALLWAVHPIHVKVVSYASSRADILLFIFILLALIGFLRRWNVIWILIFSLGAILSKEAAIVLPILLIGCGWALDPEAPFSRKSFMSALRRTLPSLTLVFWCWAFRLWVLRIPTEMIFLGSEAAPLFGRVLMGVRSLFILHGLLFFPLNFRLARYLAPSEGFALLFDVLGLLVLSALVWIAWRWRKRQPILALGVGWVLVQYLPYFNFVQINWDISEHWMYLPSVGIISCGIFACADWMKRRQNLSALIFAGLALTLIIMTASRNPRWKDDVTLFEPEVKVSPESRWVHYNLASGYEQRGMLDEALKHYHKSLSLGPPRSTAYWTIGRVLIQKKQFEEAVFYYDQAVQLDPMNPDYRALLGDAYFLTRRYEDAEREYLKAQELDPKNAAHQNSLGVLYIQIEKIGPAAQAFHKAIQIDPFNQAARRNLRLLKFFSDKIRLAKDEGSKNADNK